MKLTGLDVGASQIKVVSLSPSGKGKYKLEGWGAAEVPRGVMDLRREGSLGRVAEVVKKLFHERKISAKQVVISVPEGEEVYTKLMMEPKMTVSELRGAIPWEAEQYIPVPLSEVNYSFEVIGEKEGGGLEVLLVAASKKLVGRYEEMVELAGLVPVAMETELLALSRSLVPPDSREVVLVVDIGARLTSMGVVRRRELVLARSVAIAGEALTRALETELSLERDQAETFKRSYGLDRSQLEGKVAGVLFEVVRRILSEVKKTLNFYQSKHGVDPVRVVVLSGGGARLPELVNTMVDELEGVEVQLGNPLMRVKVGKKEGGELGLMGPQLAVAVGLAMKEA